MSLVQSARAFVRRAGAPAAILLGLAACSSDVPPPTAQLGASSAAVSSAERAGALEFAPVELQTAREKLARAQDALEDERNEEARRLAEQAQVDAELAETRAQGAVARQAVEALRRDLDTLRGELDSRPTS
jgi:chromosome segregation ATPase